MRIVGGVVLAAVLGLVTYEIVVLVIACAGLLIAVASLLLGLDNKRDNREIRGEQKARAASLVGDLESDLDGGG